MILITHNKEGSCITRNTARISQINELKSSERRSEIREREREKKEKDTSSWDLKRKKK